MKLKDDKHRYNFKELVKESQQRIEHIEKNAKYLRRENEVLKIDNELLLEQVAAKVSSRKMMFEQSKSDAEDPCLGIKRFEYQRKSLPDDLRKVPHIVSPQSADMPQFPPVSYPERRSTSSYKDSSSEERNIKPSEVKRASLSKRKSIDERRRSSTIIRKHSTDRKTQEIDHNPAASDERDESPTEIPHTPQTPVSPLLRGNSLGRISNSYKAPHDWVRHKRFSFDTPLPVETHENLEEEKDEKKDEKKGTKSSWLMRNMSFLRSTPQESEKLETSKSLDEPEPAPETIFDENGKTPLGPRSSTGSTRRARRKAKQNYNPQRRGSGKGRAQLGFRTGYIHKYCIHKYT